MIGILLRQLPILEYSKIIDMDIWQLMYVLLPEITYYLLIIYSLKKVFEIKDDLLNKIIPYILISPNLLFALKLISLTLTSLSIFLSIFLT